MTLTVHLERRRAPAGKADMKVVIGVDSSTFSDDAIDYVVNSPWPVGTTFVVVSAVAPIFLGPGEVAAPQSITELNQEQERYHREIAQGAARRLSVAGLKAIARVIHGDPRTVLEEIARSEEADMVVVGSHGRSGIKKLLLGSVAAHVIAHAPCPVLVVRVPAWKKESEERKESASETLLV